MTWNNVFGGPPQNPSQVSERAIALTSSITLFWPWNSNDEELITAKILDVTPSGPGFVITMPDARAAGAGEAVIFRNLGASAFQVQKSDSTAIVTVNPSIAQFVYVMDNSTSAGNWGVLQFGAGASSVDAAALAGAGLKAIASMLNQDFPVTELVSSYSVTVNDRAKLFSANPTAGAETLSLPALATVTNGFFFGFANTGTGSWEIDPDGSEEIDNLPSLSINPGESLFVCAGGTQWYSVGRGRSAIFVQTMINKDVSGSSNVTLTAAEAGNIIQRYYGALTGNIEVIVPAAVGIYFVSNDTTGSFDLEVSTASGSGVTVPQGERVILYCDGNDVLDADTVVPTSSFTMASGSVGSPGLAFTVDPDTGFFRPGNNILAISAGATEIARFDQDGLDVSSGELMIAGTDVVTMMIALN